MKELVANVRERYNTKCRKYSATELDEELKNVLFLEALDEYLVSVIVARKSKGE